MLSTCDFDAISTRFPAQTRVPLESKEPRVAKVNGVLRGDDGTELWVVHLAD